MKKKLLFLIHTLGGGGAEKALVNLVNHLDTSKYYITVETMFDDGVNAKSLRPHIHYISKKAPNPKGISMILKLIPAKVLYRYFIGNEQYDLLIAYMHGAPVKVISGNRNAKKIAWLHNGNPETSTMFSCWLSREKAFEAYRSCSCVVGVCHSVADAFIRFTHINDNVKVVYNTLDTEYILEQAKKETSFSVSSNTINIVSTGRLGKEKGYARLIDICKRLKDENYSFKLYLIGSGSEENNLKNQIHDLSLENEVELLGYQENPYQYVNKCDVFICSSFTEGLSTATIEALILGKAIMSTEVSGAREILGDSEYGLIVDNSNEGIYEGLKQLLENKALIQQYGMKAQQRSNIFNTDTTVHSAESLFDSVIQ